MKFSIMLATSACGALALVGCGGSSPPVSAEAACSALEGKAIPASSISLPTSGGSVTSATLQAANATTGAPEFCKVTGALAPIDPQSFPIKFQVNLPTNWNGKAMHLGGGGYNGQVVTGESNIPGTPTVSTPIPTPLMRGYATFGSDSGHPGSSPLDASNNWGLNAEAVKNFGGDQLKKTLDAAKQLIQARYGKAASRHYFAGGSQGGHEGFLVIQRWPQEYDGVIAYYPVYNFTGLVLSQNRQVKAFYSPAAVAAGAPLNAAKLSLLRGRVLQACDSLDGAADGIISNTAACDAAFTVTSLRCASGADEGDTCLSDAQITALNVSNSEMQLGFGLQSGVNTFPRWPIFHSGFTDSDALLVPFAPNLPPVLALLAQPLISQFVMGDPSYNQFNFDPSANASRVAQVSEIIDANSVVLDAYRARGGKLIMLHGTTDYLNPPGASIDYYRRLVGRYGQSETDAFTRFYMVPGYGHSNGAFTLSWDSLPVLENWVEQGVAPGPQVGVDASTATRGRTRPLCLFPTFPKLNGGATNLDAASSYSCVAS